MNVDDIIAQAKDMLLNTGDHPPALYVELDRSVYACVLIPQLAMKDNAFDRARVCFDAGRRFGLTTYKKYKSRKVTGLCVVAKVWLGMTLEEDLKKGKPFVRASQNPNRKDCLCITTIEEDSMQQGTILYEILRDRSGNVTDLFHDPESMRTQGEGGDEIYGAFLPCFLSGLKSCDQHQSRAVHEFRRTYDRYSPPFVEEMFSPGKPKTDDDDDAA